jgi:hypothetical protein
MDLPGSMPVFWPVSFAFALRVHLSDCHKDGQTGTCNLCHSLFEYRPRSRIWKIVQVCVKYIQLTGGRLICALLSTPP